MPMRCIGRRTCCQCLLCQALGFGHKLCSPNLGASHVVCHAFGNEAGDNKHELTLVQRVLSSTQLIMKVFYTDN